MACFNNLGCMFVNLFYFSFLVQKYTQPRLEPSERKHINILIDGWATLLFKNQGKNPKY